LINGLCSSFANLTWRFACLDASENHDNYDCFVCCILTHGEKLTTKAVPESKSEPTVFTKEVLYAKDAAFELNDLKKPFEADKCPSLAGKPKLFFVQV